MQSHRYLLASLLFLAAVFRASPLFAAPPSIGQACVDAVKADPEEARSICAQADAKDPSPRVKAAYALTLALSEEDSYSQVYDLTREAEAEAGDDPEVLALIVQACTAGDQSIYAKQVGERLAEIAGDDWWAVMVLYDAALDRGDYGEARELLDRLGELDTPAEELGAAEERYAITVPPLNHGLMIAGTVSRYLWLSWLFGMLATIGLGLLIARAQRRAVDAWTPKSVEEAPPVPLRGLLSRLLQISSLFYFSLLALVTLALVMFFLAMLAASLVVGVIFYVVLAIFLVMVIAAIREIFGVGWSDPVVAPGLRVDSGREADLLGVTDSAAASMRVKAAELNLSVGTRLEIVGQGKFTQLVFGFPGRTRQCLVVGLGLFEGLDSEDFAVLLAREYASIEAGGGAGHWAGQALRAMDDHLERQAQAKGQLRKFNPALYLLRGYRWLFRRMASGALREQEVLADRRAAAVHGSERLADALVSLADCRARFHARLEGYEAQLIASGGGAIANIYTDEPQKPASEAEIAARLDAELNAGDPVIGGLSLSARIAKIEALSLPGPETKPSGRPLAELLHDHALLYAVFTNAYRIHLERTLNRFVSLVPELEEEIKARGAVQIDRIGLD